MSRAQQCGGGWHRAPKRSRASCIASRTCRTAATCTHTHTQKSSGGADWQPREKVSERERAREGDARRPGSSRALLDSLSLTSHKEFEFDQSNSLSFSTSQSRAGPLSLPLSFHVPPDCLSLLLPPPLPPSALPSLHGSNAMLRGARAARPARPAGRGPSRAFAREAEGEREKGGERESKMVEEREGEGGGKGEGGRARAPWRCPS